MLTVNDSGLSTGQPSAPVRVVKANVDGDATYPAGGYDMSAQFPGQTVQAGPMVPSYNGAALNFFRLEDASGTPKLVIYDSANGEPTTETVTADQSGHTGVDVWALAQ